MPKPTSDGMRKECFSSREKAPRSSRGSVNVSYMGVASNKPHTRVPNFSEMVDATSESIGEELPPPVAKRPRVGKDTRKVMGTVVPGVRKMRAVEVSTGSTENVELSVPGSASAAAKPTACDIMDMPFFTPLLSQIQISGKIGTGTYIAAWTNGDGACGLHSLFGIPTSRQLFAENIRQRVLDTLSPDLSSVVNAMEAPLLHVLVAILDSMWEHCKEAAKTNAANEALENESNTI